MTEADYLETLTKAVEHEEQNAERRRGKNGPWCFSCGYESAGLAPCGCAFPEAFHCAGLKTLCGECRKGHHKAAAHLQLLFSAKRLAVYRADSKRSRYFRFLRDALEQLGDKGNAQARTLRSLLGSNADPRADEESAFRSAVLDAFRRSHFSDFRGLAKQIEEEDRIDYATKLAMAPQFQRLISQIEGQK